MQRSRLKKHTQIWLNWRITTDQQQPSLNARKCGKGPTCFADVFDWLQKCQTTSTNRPMITGAGQSWKVAITHSRRSTREDPTRFGRESAAVRKQVKMDISFLVLRRPMKKIDCQYRKLLSTLIIVCQV